jgi:hypothetical protein
MRRQSVAAALDEIVCHDASDQFNPGSAIVMPMMKAHWH